MSSQTLCNTGDTDLGGNLRGPVLTVKQFEEKHPGTRGRMRGYIFRADVGMPDFAGLSGAVVRLGRTVMLDEAAVLAWLASRTQQPRSPARNPHGRAGRKPGRG